MPPKIAGAVEIKRRLAHALGAMRTVPGRRFDDLADHLRHVAEGRDQIVVQVLGAAGDVFLHQRQADALRGAAVDLALDLLRIDRLADVVRGGDLQHLHGAEVEIDLHQRDLGREAVAGVRHALPVRIERRGRRIEAAVAGQHVAVIVGRQVAQRGTVLELRELGLEVERRQLARLAGDEGLARGRGLAGIEGARGVAHHQRDVRGRDAQRVRRDLRQDGVRALPDIDRAAIERDAAVGGDADLHLGRIAERGVADAVPGAGDAGAALHPRGALH